MSKPTQETDLAGVFGQGVIDNKPAPGAAPPVPPKLTYFLPTFEHGHRMVNSYGGSMPLNPIYFATAETAAWLVDHLAHMDFPGAEIFDEPYPVGGGNYGASGPDGSPSTWRMLQFPDGSTANAGYIAEFFINHPEAEFPGTANKMVTAVLRGIQKAYRERPNG